MPLLFSIISLFVSTESYIPLLISDVIFPLLGRLFHPFLNRYFKPINIFQSFKQFNLLSNINNYNSNERTIHITLNTNTYIYTHKSY